MVGRTVFQYKFLEKLGSGGMGEIYKAQDTRLNRFVAIKVLTPGKTGDPERRKRFVQEAQAASALNHPNIITIHDILSEGDTQYMVMEYVAGKTLLELIPVGGLRVPLALQYGSQMADALSVAHAAGIIHRDFKPANVMVNANGLVKVLDFGLAKLTDRGMNQSSDETLTGSPLTVEGAIMGTVSYMSPEQAEGKKVDARSDVFAFGSVLYEMVTGRRAFSGESGISTLSAVLRDEARPISQVAPDVPDELDQIIIRCLRKDPDARWQTMRDVEAALSHLKRQSDSGSLYRSHMSMTAVPAAVPASPPSFPPMSPPEPTRIEVPTAAGPVSTPPVAPVTPATAPVAPATAKKGAPVGLILGLVALVLVALGGGGWWWFTHQKPAPEPATKAAESVPPATTPAAPPETTAPATPPAPVETVLNNDNIVQLVQAKTPAASIIDQIRTTKTNFDLSPAEVTRMTAAGVPQTIIAVMRNPKGPAPSTQVATSATPGATSSTPAKVPPVPVPVPVPKAPTNTTATVPPPPKTTATQAVPVTVGDALPFRIILDEDVPADASGGQSVSFTVLDGLKVDESVVIARGANVTGQVAGEAGKKKFLGMGGKMTFRLVNANAVDGSKIAVRATAGHGGEGPPTRQFTTAKGAKTKEVAATKGTEYIAYTDGQHVVSVRK